MRFDIDKDLLTTVVGSYPSKPSRKTLMDSYYKKEDPYLTSLESAVNLQVKAGIELISDGQTRNDMVRIFARELRGYRVKEKVEIISKIGYKKPITVKDQKLVKEMIPENIGLKGILTGPFTLVKSSVNNYYQDEKEAVFDTAEALSKEAKELSKICNVVQVDEPFLSVEYQDYAKEAVEMILDLDVPTSLHVCGDVTDIAEILIEYDVDILDHEFARNPSLYDTYKDLSFPQKIAPGVVTTSSPVENVDTITNRIKKAVKYFGEKTIIDPDCGLKNLPEEIAYKKLENMVKARDVVLDERS